MVKLATVILSFLVILGLLEIFIAIKYPSQGKKSLAQKLEQKMFKRGYVSIFFSLTSLGMLFTNVLSAGEALIITLGLLLASEYGLARMKSEAE